MVINEYIEHTNLDEKATDEDIKQLCREAIKYGFYGICVYPKYVSLAKSIIGNRCKVITVVGFPEGNQGTTQKVKESEDAVRSGADEIDMVINKAELHSGNDDRVFEDIKAVVKASENKPVKVIIEARELNEDEKRRAINIVNKSGARFVKTSTGKSSLGGANVKDVALIKSIVGDNLGIKAAGGISDRRTAEAMINAGAIRLGTSKSVKIITE